MPAWATAYLAAHPELAALPVVKRARASLHLQQPDGTTLALCTGTPMYYQSTPGNWQPIDTDLRDVGGGVLSGLGTPARITTDGAVHTGGSHAQMPRRVVRYRPATGGITGMAPVPARGTPTGDRYTRGGVGWAYTVWLTETGARAELVLSQVPPLPGGTQATDYLCIEEEISGLALPDGEVTGALAFEGYTFPAPSAADARGSRPTTRRWAKTVGGTQYLYSGVPVSWLQGATYPVTIDPDFADSTNDGRIEGSSAVDYATARSTATAHSTTSTVLIVGQDLTGGTTYWVERDFLKFDTSAIGAGSTVTQVNLKLTPTLDNSTTDFNVQIVEQDWSAQDPIATANREAAYDACLAGTSAATLLNSNGVTLNQQYTSPNLTTSYVNKTGNTYYSIRSDRDAAGTQPTNTEELRFAAQEHTTAAYRPVLTVAYSGSTAHALGGQGDGVAADTGTLITGWALAVTAGGLAAVSGSVLAAWALLSSIAGVGAATGDLTGGMALRTQTDGVATLTGGLTVMASGQLDGSMTGLAVVTGSLRLSNALAGQSDGVAGLSDAFQAVLTLGGTSTGLATTATDLTPTRGLGGAIQGLGVTPSAALDLLLGLTATLTGQGGLVATVVVAWALAGSTPGTGVTTASLAVTAPTVATPVVSALLVVAVLGRQYRATVRTPARRVTVGQRDYGVRVV